MGDDLLPTGVDQVRSDNLEVGHLAFQHLTGLGCRHLACVTSRADHGGMFLRAMAFTAAAARAGLSRPPLYTAARWPDTSPWSILETQACDSFDAVAARIAAADPRPTGIFVTQDIETVAMYQCLANHGLRPGKDVHVVSCNNDQALALLHPRPATIDLDPAAIGRWALRRLINRVARPDDAPIQMLIKPRLVLSEPGEPL